MTVDSHGVAMTETLRPLIVSAAPYFGVEMANTATVSQRINRNARVEIGPTTVIEYLDLEKLEPARDEGTPPATAAETGVDHP
jgi:hypothetical protein